MFLELSRVIQFIIKQLIHIWPLLLLTIPLSVMVKEVGISKKINTLLKKNMTVSIIIATLIGGIAPFCSCSVIPVIASMLITGVPLAPIMSFWLASPSMDPEIFFLSVASLGWTLAIGRMAATFLMSLAGGFITHFLIKGKFINPDNIIKNQENSSRDETDNPTDQTKKKIDFKKLLKESKAAIWMILKFLIVAYLIEALIVFYVPESLVSNIFGTNKLTSIIRATLIGIPLYTTNLSALGLMGGLISKGLSEGAALAFLIGGATTTLPAMAAVYKLVHRKVFFLYLSITIAFSLLSGVVYEIIIV